MPLIRKADSADMTALRGIAEQMGDRNAPDYFERSLAEQQAGNRDIYMAVAGPAAVGYVQLNRRPTYVPFRRLGMFEIQDLCVVPSARRQGVGRLLVSFCEDVAREEGAEEIGIAVGLYARYGSAQRLYVSMGYVPDGAGIAYDDLPVTPGEMRAVDDLLTLKLIKSL